MKKIKILYITLFLFMIFGVLGITGSLLTIFLGEINLLEVYAYRNFGILTPFISILISIMLLCGIFNIQKALQGFLRNTYFNAKSAKHLKTGGLILVGSSILAILNGFINGSFVDKESLLLSSIIYCLLLIIGIAVLAVSDIITKGEVIEQENLLTI
ncbi:DUF2975 domain-containing protein [Flavobacterium antarcticum]|uniref:DUF2975 domain-containing protein n=1 Tax=Flavobacterium antarcticum TaxID=271155 RepID=UPI0012F9396D|nr:DUF2975 domain-containing protein [Flavobacterium antarcticum]